MTLHTSMIHVNRVQNISLFHRPDQHFAINAAAANRISDARPVFDSLDWSEESSRMFERVGQTGERFYACYSPTNEVSSCVYNHILHIR